MDDKRISLLINEHLVINQANLEASRQHFEAHATSVSLPTTSMDTLLSGMTFMALHYRRRCSSFIRRCTRRGFLASVPTLKAVSHNAVRCRHTATTTAAIDTILRVLLLPQLIIQRLLLPLLQRLRLILLILL